MARRNVTGKASKQFGRHTKKGVVKCPDCGSTYPVYRMHSQLVKKARGHYSEGHIKDLYCFVCKEVTKHRELSKDDIKYNY